MKRKKYSSLLGLKKKLVNILSETPGEEDDWRQRFLSAATEGNRKPVRQFVQQQRLSVPQEPSQLQAIKSTQ